MENITLNMGEIIRDMRKAKGLTQDALAQAAGVSVQAVSKWETGQSLPDVTLLPAIADFFGVTLDSLFGRESPAQEAQEKAAPVGPFPDDGKLHIVQYMGGRLMSAEECVDGKAIRLCLDKFEKFEGSLAVEVHGSTRIEGNANCALTSAGDILVKGDVNGAATAGGDFTCKGSLNGAATAGGSVCAEGGGATINMKGSFAGLKESLSGLAGSLSGLSGMFGNRRTGSGVGAHMNAFFRGELPDDDVIRVVQMQGRRIMTAEESAGPHIIRLSVEHVTEPLNVEIYGSAEIKGDISGNATAGDSMNCGAIGGDAQAGDSLNCGTVGCNATAGDGLTCGTVGGSATAGDGLTCGTVGGSVRAGDSVRITGDVYGNVTASDSVTCGNVGGNVKADSIRCSGLSGAKDQKNASRSESAPSQEMPDFSAFGSRRGALNVVQIMDGKVLSAEESRGDQAVRLCLEDADGITVYIHGDAHIEGGVEGDVHANGIVECGGVEGSVSAGGSVTCGGVEGDVNCGGSVSCGSVEGEVTAGGVVNCGDVEGDVSAGGTVSCGDVEGDVSAGATVNCGSIEGNVEVKGNSDKCSVTCEGVEGDVSVLNATIDCGCGSIGGSVEARSDKANPCTVTCEGVEGDVSVLNATVDCGCGSIGGSVEARSDQGIPCTITCETIEGDVTASGPVTINGDVSGDVYHK